MKASPRAAPQIAPYLERYEQQQAQRRRERQLQQRRRSSDVANELSFISAIEHDFEQEAEQQRVKEYESQEDSVEHPWESSEVGGEDADTSFDLPSVDMFPAAQELPSSPFAVHGGGGQQLQHEELPKNDEFVDAATFLEKNELGGDDSFSQDVGPDALEGGDWNVQNGNGRPSDFFKRRSRNMDCVELSSPKAPGSDNLNPFESDTEGVGDEKNLGPDAPATEDQPSPSDLRQGLALHDHFDGSLGLSGSDTALSSGYDVHFDSTRLMYTPNSMKYLQEKSRFRTAAKVPSLEESTHSLTDHAGEARKRTRNGASEALPEPEVPKDPSPSYVATLKRGPGVIKEALNNIDALIDMSAQPATLARSKERLDMNRSEDVREFVRPYDLPMESGLPLSRTTDSWGEDVSVTLNEDDMSRRSRETERLSSGADGGYPTMNGVSRSRSQEGPELDTIREVPLPATSSDSFPPHQEPPAVPSRFSQVSQTKNREVPADTAIHQAHRNQRTPSSSNRASNRASSREHAGASEQTEPQPAEPVRFDRSIAELAASQRPPFLDQMYPVEQADLRAGGDHCSEHIDTGARVDGYQRENARSGRMESTPEYAQPVPSDALKDDFGDLQSRGHPHARSSPRMPASRTERTSGRAMGEHKLGREDTRTSAGINESTSPMSAEDAFGGLRFRHRAHSRSSQRVPDNRREAKPDRAVPEPKTKGVIVPKTLGTSDRVVDVLNHNEMHVAADAVMIPRRCRRLLCAVGDVMTEEVIVTNGTQSIGRICVSLLPLSAGCQQFSVSPAVLELGPKTSSAFYITFNACYAGPVSGIFQFRGIGAESLFQPYEVIMEANVKGELALESSKPTKPNGEQKALPANSRVKELRASASMGQVEIGPSFVHVKVTRGKNGEKIIRKAKFRLVNNTAKTLPFKVKCAHENLKFHPDSGMIQPASEASVSVVPISQPFTEQRGEMASAEPHPKTENWCGALAIQVGKVHSQEVSVVVDRRVMRMLPPFDEIARSRHQLSSQTDSFYYTKRGSRRGLYFHARAVEFGSCNVGESHEVPVYVCNGSKAPMTVLLQELQEPFSCSYSTTTIQPRKFIEVPVTFTPKVVGKVSTSLFAFSVSEKAVVTLVARGI